MVSILIKNVPDNLRRKIKELAVKHRRSMNMETLVLLESAVEQVSGIPDTGAPVKGEFPLTDEFINNAKRQGRE